MKKRKRIGIQGIRGAFHEEACGLVYPLDEVDIIPFQRFDELALAVKSSQIDSAVMAIENSIAGTILQNYRLIRENNLWVSGESYLRISHQFLALKESKIEQIKEVHSHPMAINQSLKFLNRYPEIKIVERSDTALAAKEIADLGLSDRAAIASSRAASIYNLNILSKNIETHKDNYTRFFLLEKSKIYFDQNEVNKASVYIKIMDEKGSLLKVLKEIDECQLNMSKLQSFPVMGEFRAYFFHIDLEFDHFDQFKNLMNRLTKIAFDVSVTGIYNRADLPFNVNNNDKL